MARNYAALPHDYLEEMELLNDAEFGRICRALLKYSRDGEIPALSGSERVFFPRVRMQEDRFQASYEAQIEQKRQAGRKSGEKRKGTALNGVQQRSAPLSIVQREPTETNGNNETKTKTETKTDPPSFGEGGDARTRGVNLPGSAKGPTLEMVQEYARLRGFPEFAKPFFDYYAAAGWRDAENKPVYNWQQKFISWEMREKKKAQSSKGTGPYGQSRPSKPDDVKADIERMEKYLQKQRKESGT